MFKNVSMAPSDPILGLIENFKKDPRKNKVNLGIGVYQDELGKVPILKIVKKAEKLILKKENTKNYLPIEGKRKFRIATQNLLLGNNHEIIKKKKICTLQTPGGTGALRIAAEFISKKIDSTKQIWISNPSWQNHKNIFIEAGLKVNYYDYYDSINNRINFYKMLKSLNKANKKDILLIHGCCHNPTGADLNTNQWKTLSKFVKEKKIIPIFDFAYQGFKKNLESDTESLKIFLEDNSEIIIANSYSKNFGLYNERIGSCNIIAKNNQIKQIFSQMKSIVRSNYSNPPAHGAEIITMILSDENLKKEWIKELEKMRLRIKNIRELLATKLTEKNAKKNFEFIRHQHGMLSLTGLDKTQVMKLKEKHGVYILDSGRINLAGLTSEKIDFLCNSIIDVL